MCTHKIRFLLSYCITRQQIADGVPDSRLANCVLKAWTARSTIFFFNTQALKLQVLWFGWIRLKQRLLYTMIRKLVSCLVRLCMCAYQINMFSSHKKDRQCFKTVCWTKHHVHTCMTLGDRKGTLLHRKFSGSGGRACRSQGVSEGRIKDDDKLWPGRRWHWLTWKCELVCMWALCIQAAWEIMHCNNWFKPGKKLEHVSRPSWHGI